jgi:hypothetical protein
MKNPNFAHTLYFLITVLLAPAYSQVTSGERLIIRRVDTDSLNAATVVTTPKWRVPDYVFDPSYDRMSLSEIESFVRMNRHLPDVPSAKDIEAEGMDLAEMNLKLLKTVEELTLHVIDLDKALKSQQAQSARLENEMKVLQIRNRKK